MSEQKLLSRVYGERNGLTKPLRRFLYLWGGGSVERDATSTCSRMLPREKVTTLTIKIR